MKRFVKYLKLIPKNSLALSIVVIVVLLIGNSFLIYNNTTTLKGNIKTKNDLLAIKNTLNDLLVNIQTSDRAMKGYFITSGDEFKKQQEDVKNSSAGNFEKLNNYFEEISFDLDSLNTLKQKSNEFFQLNDELIEKITNGSPEEVVEVVNQKKLDQLQSEFTILSSSYRNHIDQTINTISNESDDIFSDIFILQIIVLLIGIPMLIFLIRKFKKNESVRAGLFKNLQESNESYVFNPNVKSDITNEAEIIEDLINNLKKASNFINDISLGNYDVEWEGMTEEISTFNKNNLAGELTNMKEQMKKVKKEDEVRMWTTEGLAKFAEIVRGDFKDLDDMANTIVSEIVNYLDVNQGSMFLVNDEDGIFLELKACYAYDRQKFIEKKIEPGQGMIGQAYKEGETTHLTKIPENYVFITSGLGEATPTSLLIVPLKVNEVTVGLVEIASFTKFEPHEIEFIEKVGEIIASSVSSIRTNEKTKNILKNSQEQAEQLRSQEEEMRQNMEELEATQEEMRRKEKGLSELLKKSEEKESELLKEIDSLKSKISSNGQ